MPEEEKSLEDLRQMGNHNFSKGDYDSALSCYNAAVEKADSMKDKEALVLNLCNRSACLFKMERYEEAQTDAAQAVVSSDGDNLKALFRLAKAQVALKSYTNAIDTVDQAMAVLNDDKDQEKVKGQRKSFKDIKDEASKSEKKLQEEGQENLTSIKEVARAVSIREFQRGKDLGVGNFSEIVVCHHKKTNEKFALKIIEKKQAADLAKRQHPNVYNEIQMERRTLLERLPHHRNVVRMYHAFQDYNSLYYLMDLTDGGEMWSSLRWDNKMVGNHRALNKVYLAELLDALEHMHTHGIVHRDLKPENLLFNSGGHVIVIDFGTAKDLVVPDLNGPEFVGTPDFMSPEAVRGTAGMEDAAKAKSAGKTGADHTLDLYAFGAVAFQLHTGMTPYWSPSPYLSFLKIKRGNLMRPWGIADDDAWDFISGLMRVDPQSRLGADCFELTGNLKRTMVKKEGGYDVIRKHPYFSKRSEFGDLPLDDDFKQKTPIPTLRDLCIRSCVEKVQQDALDLELCDKHPPGDGSKHDMMRLDERDRKCVMHLLERRKLLNEPTIYKRFFDDNAKYRLDKVRPGARDFVGLTRMSDDMGKFPDPREHDPYAEVKPIEPVDVYVISNPLLVKSINDGCDDAARKTYTKQFKKCVSTINRSRPKMAVVCGSYVDPKCRKLLAKISDTIPVVVVDGSTYFSFWHSGIQCLALQTATLENKDGNAQMAWLREELEQCRMARNLLFIFSDSDPREFPETLLKYIIRGKAQMIVCPSLDTFEVVDVYSANETVDDASVKSTDSQEDESDNHMCRMVGSGENGLRVITMTERDTWDQEYKPIVVE